MKKQFASLLFLLSSVAFISPPALSMQEEDPYDGFGFVGSRSDYIDDLEEDSSEGSSDDFRSSYITDEQDPRVELDEFLSKQNYPRAFRSMKEEGNTASDIEIVRYLLASNGFTEWSRLSPFEKASVVGRIAYEADRDELEEFLNKQNYPRAFRSIKESGNPASSEEIVGFLLTSNGYKKWPLLSLDKRNWVVDRITMEEEVDHVREFLSGQNFPKAFRSMKEGNKASNEEIAEYLITSNGYKRWELLGEEPRRMAFDHIIGGEDRRELQELLRARDFSSAFRSMKEGNTASNKEIVRFLLTSNGYTKWEKISKGLRAAVKHSITGKNPEEALYLFDDGVDFLKAYRLLKGSKELPLSEEVVRAILEQKGFKFWDKLQSNLRRGVVSYLIRGHALPFPFPEADVDSILAEERAAVVRKVEELFTEEMERYEKDEIIREAQIIDDEEDVSPRVAAITKHKGALLPEEMSTRERVYWIESLLSCDPALIEVIAQNKSTFFPDAWEIWNYNARFQVLREGGVEQLRAIAQNKDAFITADMDSGDIEQVIRTLLQGDSNQIKTVALGTKLMPSLAHGYINFLKQFLKGNVAAIQILLKNKEMFFYDGISEYVRENMIRAVMEGDIGRTQALIQQKDVFFTNTMGGYVRCQMIQSILSSPVSADEIGAIGAVLAVNAATLFTADMDDEDRKKIIDVAFECNASELDNRVVAIEANAPTLLKDMKGRDRANVIITALGIEAGEIGLRAAAIARNEKAYFTEAREDAARLTISLLNAAAAKIDGLAKNLKMLLPDNYWRIKGIEILLKADPAQVQVLAKHADLLFKGVSFWFCSGIIEKAVTLSVDEIDRCVAVIATVCSPGDAFHRLLGASLDSQRGRIIEMALDGKSVGEVRACAEAIKRNVPTFLINYFTKSQVGTYIGSDIIGSALTVNAEELDRRAEGINRHATVLFPKEIVDDYDRGDIMGDAIRVSRDKLDGAIAKIAEAYARVEGTADSRERAQVIRDILRVLRYE